MKESFTLELQKLYDDSHVSPLVQEVCEYYASGLDYEDGSYMEEIEPREIFEPVYTLFLLQNREGSLYELSYIHKKYPHLFTSVEQLYEDILIHMDVNALETENAKKLSEALNSKTTSEEIFTKINSLCAQNDDISDALDAFCSWIHNFYS
ncbi:hypothetical protein [Butyrivibrio sp. AC2005]|uniref:hypothetical protein n=1 Tax=Butyrivibrio sp. AC2005 TaxID=1280672 RepID=UPI0012DEBFFF|nr:hypothetical protein [Butyrivibrio sp. AC2005]